MKSKLHFRWWIALQLFGTVPCALLAAVPTAEAPSRPNIILILADDMGYSDLGCMGSEIRTPNLDRLAKTGALMTNFYTTSRCSPSRASLLTGQYSHRVGIGHMTSDWKTPAYRGFVSNETALIPEILRESGYRTLMTGKWHIGDQRPHWPINRGFDRFYGIPAGGGVYFWPPVGLDRPVYLNDKVVTPGEGWYSTDAFTDVAIDFIKEAKRDEKPFFLYAAYIAPHFPLQAWETDIDKYAGVYDGGYEPIRRARFQRQQELGLLPQGSLLPPGDYPAWSELTDPQREARKMQVYAAMVDRLDQNVGRLMAALEAEGLAENTIIFFLSDNGGCAEQHDRTPGSEIGSSTSFLSYGKPWANVSNTPYRKYKSMTHEGGLLSPLVAHWPAGLKQPGLVSHEPIHIIDFMATCLDVAGVPYPEIVQGKPNLPQVGQSFLPLLQGAQADPRRLLFWEHEGNQAVRQGSWKLVRRWSKSWELYDLSHDSAEMNDLGAQEPERKSTLIAAYQEWASVNGVQNWPVAKGAPPELGR